ncbi:hypothetical protein RJT34_14701 [Clitoria ternatea]|uniref:Uncharacterized protein n=1 Tax=Clitoria ternatea TaxID=43366 RepID=A0AAN9PMW4_CLITE
MVKKNLYSEEDPFYSLSSSSSLVFWFCHNRQSKRSHICVVTPSKKTTSVSDLNRNPLADLQWLHSLFPHFHVLLEARADRS